MFLLYIRNNEDLLQQINNTLSSKNVDYELAFSEDQLSDTDGYIVTNIKLKSFPDRSRILYYGFTEGYTCFQDPQELLNYMTPGESKDISHVEEYPLDDLEPMDIMQSVMDLLSQDSDGLEEIDMSDIIQELEKDPEPRMRILLAKKLPEPEVQDEPEVQEEPEVPALIEPEEHIEQVEAQIVVPEELPQKQSAYVQEPEDEELEEVAPPPQRVIRSEPVYTEPCQAPQPRQYRPAPAMADTSALPSTNIHQRTIRRREDIYAARNMRTQPPLGRRGSLHATQSVSRRNHVYVITGTSPRCGVSSFAYSLASALSKGSLGEVLLIDLDILKPDLSKRLTGLYDLMEDGDDTISNFATMNLDDMMCEIEYLTSKISTAEGAHFSLIRGSSLTFKERKLLCSLDYTPTIKMLNEVYSNIVIDMGHYNGMQPYQESLINNIYSVIMIIDCSTLESAREGAAIASQVGESYCGVLSKYNDRVNVFKMQSTIQRAILGKMPSRTSAADIWRTGEPFGMIREPKFSEDWSILLDGVKRL